MKSSERGMVLGESPGRPDRGHETPRSGVSFDENHCDECWEAWLYDEPDPHQDSERGGAFGTHDTPRFDGRDGSRVDNARVLGRHERLHEATVPSALSVLGGTLFLIVCVGLFYLFFFALALVMETP
jgi:hypothetical protein